MKIKKLIVKLKLKYERSLIKKNMELRSDIRHLNKLLEETKIENHKLIDEITLKNIKIRELNLNK